MRLWQRLKVAKVSKVFKVFTANNPPSLCSVWLCPDGLDNGARVSSEIAQHLLQFTFGLGPAVSPFALDNKLMPRRFEGAIAVQNSACQAVTVAPHFHLQLPCIKLKPTRNKSHLISMSKAQGLMKPAHTGRIKGGHKSARVLFGHEPLRPPRAKHVNITDYVHAALHLARKRTAMDAAMARTSTHHRIL